MKKKIADISQLKEVITDYNNHFSTQGKLRDTDTFYQWILSKLDPKPNKRLLDVACGEGHLLKFAIQRGVRAEGIDFSNQAVHTAQKTVGKKITIVADGEELPFPRSCFDYATNLGSLEHFISPERGLSEMHRVLKRNGQIALVLPNSYYWVDIFWHVWRKGYPVTHKQLIERFATVGEWLDFIESHGFKVEKKFKYNLCFPRTLADLGWYWRFPKKLLYVLLSPITPFNLSYSFLFICRRNDTP